MKKRFSGPQIVAKLRQADILIGQGKNVPEVCKEIEISQQTYYRWRQKYGGIDELRYVADRWRMDYNHYRPHSSLGYMAPAAFAAKCLEQGSATLLLPQDRENSCGILS